MSVPVQVPISGPYTANGSTTQFGYQFYLLLPSDLDVFVGGAKKILNTDYTVTGVGNSAGGNVVFNVAPASGLEVIIKRNTPFTRTTDYADNGDLLADVVNDDFDRLWLALQEINANFGSSISRPVGGNWTAQNLRLTMLADGTQPQDAVTYNQLFTVNGNAAAAAAAAQQSASAAATSQQAAATSASNASTSEANSGTSAALARRWAAETPDIVVADNLYSARHYASKAATSASNAATSEGIASAAATNATNAAGTANSAASTATTQADRAKTEADKLGNMNALAAAINSVVGNTVQWKGVQNVLTEGAADGDLVTVRQLRAATAGGGGSAALINGVMNNFIGAVEWWGGIATTLPNGYLAANGQIVNRADYPELWAAVNAGIFPSSTEANWQATPTGRGNYSTGDGSTTFRLPDLNGVQSGSIGALFLRGSTTPGDSNAGGLGVIRESAAPNVVAGFDAYSYAGTTTGGSGAVAWSNDGSGQGLGGTIQNMIRWNRHDFNASRNSAAYGRNSATEVRPNSIKGTWVIRVNGSFTAANTNFSVLNGAASAPASGAVVYGGDLASKYQVNGADYATAVLRSKVVGGTAPARSAVLDIGDNAAGKKTWEFTDQGDIVGPSVAWRFPTFQNGWGNSFGTTKFRKRNGMLECKFAMSGGPSNSLAFTLPADLRVSEGVTIPMAGGIPAGSSGSMNVVIAADGKVTLQNNAGGSNGVFGFCAIPLDI